MFYEEPKSNVDFFSQIIGGSKSDWESDIDPDEDAIGGN